jgi:hypothetical protein
MAFPRVCLLLLFGFVLAGCQNQAAPEKLVAVKGRVTVKGKPLAQGTVVFHPDREKGNNTATQPRAVIQSEAPGEFVVESNNAPGAPAGWYRVTVNALKSQGSTAPPVWLANQKYSDPKTSGLAVEITEASAGKPVEFDIMP